MATLLEAHRTAGRGFTQTADRVTDWHAPTPCPDWDARAVVEHVIGFHEFLLLRPLGVRARRPREDPPARWRATMDALFTALPDDAALDTPTALPGAALGENRESSPRRMLGALTADVLVHTWDLARAAGVEPAVDAELCRRALDAARRRGLPRGEMFGPEIGVAGDADDVTALVAFYGRDPAWAA